MLTSPQHDISPFAHHVCVIVGSRADPEMVRIKAGRNVAMVKHARITREIKATPQMHCNAGDDAHFALIQELAVAFRVQAGGE
jgi:hypothetical protein